MYIYSAFKQQELLLSFKFQVTWQKVYYNVYHKVKKFIKKLMKFIN